jgi:hypothetical protein
VTAEISVGTAGAVEVTTETTEGMRFEAEEDAAAEDAPDPAAAEVPTGRIGTNEVTADTTGATTGA